MVFTHHSIHGWDSRASSCFKKLRILKSTWTSGCFHPPGGEAPPPQTEGGSLYFDLDGQQAVNLGGEEELMSTVSGFQGRRGDKNVSV